jgi:hypothetical protein
VEGHLREAAERLHPRRRQGQIARFRVETTMMEPLRVGVVGGGLPTPDDADSSVPAGGLPLDTLRTMFAPKPRDEAYLKAAEAQLAAVWETLTAGEKRRLPVEAAVKRGTPTG